MWIYEQKSGRLSRDGLLVSIGYSGNGRGKNNPSLQGVRGVGPVPLGLWWLKSVYNSKNVGPYAIIIHAADGSPNNDFHDLTGRSAFRIHGDSIRAPGTASKGCIILPRAIREKMWLSRDHELKVI